MDVTKANKVLLLAILVTFIFYMNIGKNENRVIIYPKMGTYDTKGTIDENMFPTFMKTEAKLRQDPVLPIFTGTDGAGSMGYTDPTMSTFSVKDGKPILFGEFFSIIVEARDANGRHRVQGGDFWYAVVSNGMKFATAGKVIDFKNGTYELVFFAGWPGEMTLNIKLVHPSEAVQFILHDLWHTSRKVWGGQFKVGERLEVTLCRIETKGIWHDKCEYPNPQALGGSLVFLCDRPPTLPCSSFYALHSKYAPAIKLVEEKYSSLGTEHDDFYTSKTLLAPFRNGTINMKSEKNGKFDTIDSVMKSLKLPKCRPDIPEPLSDGFWENKTWHSFACDAKLWTPDEIKRCVKGKKLIFMGASTMRQWCEKLLQYLGIKRKGNKWRVNVTGIINMTFRFYPYLMSSSLELKDVGIFEVDELDSLSADMCDYVITISPWSHYELWTKEAYITRLENIRTGIIKFRKRCPEAVFVIKSSHPKKEVFSKSKIGERFTSDAIFYQFRKLLRETFSGMNVHFIDIWDMNLSHYAHNTIHMPFDVLLQELFMYFSHVCPK